MKKFLDGIRAGGPARTFLAGFAACAALVFLIVAAFALGGGALDAGSGGKEAIDRADGFAGVTSNGYVDQGFGGDGAYDAEPGVPGDAKDPESGQKLVKRAYVQAETKDYDTYVSWLDGHVRAYGGYFGRTEAESVPGQYGDAMAYHAEIRVPADKLDAFLDGVASEGNVRRRTLTVDDVTQSYSDSEAYLASLRIEQGRLQELLGQGEDLADILALEDRLSEVRYEIEAHERELRGYDDRIQYASVELDVTEVREYEEPEPEGFLARCASGLAANFEAVRDAFEDAAVWLVSHLPALAALALAIFGLGRTWAFVRRRRAGKRGQEADFNSNSGSDGD